MIVCSRCETKPVHSETYGEPFHDKNVQIRVFRVSELLDYTADELTGKNLYTLCHGEDANRLRKSHIDREYDCYEL